MLQSCWQQGADSCLARHGSTSRALGKHCTSGIKRLEKGIFYPVSRFRVFGAGDVFIPSFPGSCGRAAKRDLCGHNLGKEPWAEPGVISKH